MTANVITGRHGAETKAITIATKEEWKTNLREAQEFLTDLQPQLEQMSLNSEEDIAKWNEKLETIKAAIPENLTQEVKDILKAALTRMKEEQRPKEVWMVLQDIYCVLSYSTNIFAMFFTPKHGNT